MKPQEKIDKIKSAADTLISEGGRAISWHIRIVTGIPTPQVNYYMRKMVAQGLYISEKYHTYSIVYKPAIQTA